MNVHYLQHVDFEGLSSMETYLKEQGHTLSATHLYQQETLPTLDTFDWLIVMGGPMGIDQEAQYPWLKAEKTLIKAAIDHGKIVIGICLGAQLIADCLGAKVYKNEQREIGWFPISRLPSSEHTPLSTVIPDTMDVFHWHGDMFDIPQGADALAASEACQNQGFVFHNHVFAFQFHLETTPESALALIENCRDELDGSLYVQTEQAMLADKKKFEDINQVMFKILHTIDNTYKM